MNLVTEEGDKNSLVFFEKHRVSECEGPVENEISHHILTHRALKKEAATLAKAAPAEVAGCGSRLETKDLSRVPWTQTRQNYFDRWNPLNFFKVLLDVKTLVGLARNAVP